MHINKVNSRPTKNWVHVQLEKKEKEGRVLKYVQVENNVMSFMKLKRKNMKIFYA